MRQPLALQQPVEEGTATLFSPLDRHGEKDAGGRHVNTMCAPLPRSDRAVLITPAGGRFRSAQRGLDVPGCA